MKHRLILTRHAKSSWDHPGLTDHQRPLNQRGKQSADAIGEWLKNNGYLPGQILSSSSARTVETCERLKLDAPARFLETLYHASANTMLLALQAATEDTVLMLGHNPGIGDFAEQLVKTQPNHPRFLDYPTCATLVVDFDIKSWAEAGFGQGQTVAFIIPRELT